MGAKYVTSANFLILLRILGIFAIVTNNGFASGIPPKEIGHVDKTFLHRSSPIIPHEKNFGNEVIYQIFVDRFANGNKNNDCPHEGRFCATKQDRKAASKWYSYWGGDLRGVIQNLQYLKSLGVTRIWLTPIFENQMVTVQAKRHGESVEITSYHGYWVRDWFRLNPNFTDHGATDYGILSELIHQAEPQIKIYLDTVANHTSPADATTASLDYLNSIEPITNGGRFPHKGAIFRNGQYVMSFDHDRALKRENPEYEPFFHHVNEAISNWNDPHEVQTYQLERLVDIDQRSSLATNYLAESHDFWMSRFPGLAGYRIDTIKHVPDWYWGGFSDYLYQRHPRMESFGEYWAAGSQNPQSYEFYDRTRFSMLDFDFRRAVQDIFGSRSASFSTLVEIWEDDSKMTDATSLITFLDSHDLPRLRGMGMSYAAMKQAIALWFASRGIPCVYYGLEQDLFVTGDPGDPYNRPMMASFDQSSDMFQFTKALIKMRRDNAAARFGTTHVVHETRHIIGFERVYGEDVLFFATSKNPIQGADTFEMKGTSLPDGDYLDVISQRTYRVRAGKVPVSLRKGDIVLLSSGHRKP